MSFTRRSKGWGEGGGTSADSSMGDPQVFYFGVFDGHGGNECADFLRDQLHEYIEDGSKKFELKSTLRHDRRKGNYGHAGKDDPENANSEEGASNLVEADKKALDSVKMVGGQDQQPAKTPPDPSKDHLKPPEGHEPIQQSDNLRNAEELEQGIVNAWKELVGGYFRRFKPEWFSMSAGGRGHSGEREVTQQRQYHTQAHDAMEGIGIETVLEWSFLKADYDFVAAQADKDEAEDPVESDRALNEGDILDHPQRSHKPIGGPKRFKGGSTCSVALISTPTPTPFWHPASPSTLITSHVGDTRILLCRTADGQAVPMTSDHHPNSPVEAARMRRYAATFVTDSFGEERVQGLANTRAFGDMASKRIGVTAEPEIRRMELEPAEHSFMVLVSDGVSGTLSDQEIVDIVKEARTPDQASRDVVGFATEVAPEADNATALVIRLGGWERRSEGGLGSLGTKEIRDLRREEANDPRRRQ